MRLKEFISSPRMYLLVFSLIVTLMTVNGSVEVSNPIWKPANRVEDLLRKFWRKKDFHQASVEVPLKYHGLSEYFKDKAKRFNINPSSVCMWKVCPPSAWKASGEKRLQA